MSEIFAPPSNLTSPGRILSWRDAYIPKDRMVYAIGDIHGHSTLLGHLLASIEEDISRVSENTHGHTPSAIVEGGNLIADGQKDFRLCVDTGVYEKNGALTCFVRGGDEARFIAANRRDPDIVQHYDISPRKQMWSATQHRKMYPEHHQN